MPNTAFYQCLKCSKVRKIVQPELGIDKLNGLRQYSDLHRCSDGVLAINNIQIDANLDVRSIERVELDEEKTKQPKNRAFNIPSPNLKENIFQKNLVITHLNNFDFRAIFRNDWTDREINIGQVKLNEEPLVILESKIGGIKVKYYQSTMELDETLNKWLYVLINIVELIPPRKIGYFVEAVNFILDMRLSPPCVYDIHILQILLLADLYILESGSMEPADIPEEEELSQDHYRIIDIILERVDNINNLTILDLGDILPDDFTYVIFIVLILEQYNIINISKPPLIEEINANYIDVLID
ncbi:MAG: hypothetical protein INQ03_16180 [Candidatus Heimdallarchaeota archaeon]|nr:hypothetical protein [Candidatus Heimdallarchaeota archaeon]